MPVDSALAKILLGSASGIAAAGAHKRVDRLISGLADRDIAKADIDAIAHTELVRANPLLSEYLQYHHESQPITLAGQSADLMRVSLGSGDLSIPVWPVHVGSEICLRDFRPAPIERMENWEKSDLVQLRGRVSEKPVEDNPLYAAKQIRRRGTGVEIEGTLTSYGSTLATQDELEWELLTTVADHLIRNRSSTAFVEIQKSLGKRAALEKRLRLNQQPGGLAISTVLVFPNSNDDYAVGFGRRSADTAAHPGMFHVMPAGMFQPELGEPVLEWNIRHSVLKEFGEEMYSEELDRNATDWKYFYDDWIGVRALLDGLEDGRCEFAITGLVINLLNLRPEICSLLLVKDLHWWMEKPEMHTNWEYADRPSRSDQRGMARTELSLRNAEEEFEQLFGCSSGEWVPPGLATLWMGIDAARRKLDHN